MSNSTRRRQVCLFGLSADPPTVAHVGMARMLSSADEFEEIRILPVYRHLFANKRDRLLPYYDRMKMCQLSFDGIEKVVISDAEQRCFELMAQNLPPGSSSLEKLRVGTAALLDLLRIEEPDTDFTFAMGADTFIDLTDWKWKRSKDILKEQLNGRIVVFQRPSNEAASSSSSLLEQRVSKVNREEGAGVRIFQLNDSLSQGVSSTLIRSIRTREDLEGLVAPRVQDYIVDKKLYGFAAQED